MIARPEKPDFVFLRNGRVQGASVQSTTVSRGVRISGSYGSNAGYIMFRGSVKSTGYPLHSPVSPSLPLPCVTACHHISTGLYQLLQLICPTRQTAGYFHICDSHSSQYYENGLMDGSILLPIRKVPSSNPGAETG